MAEGKKPLDANDLRTLWKFNEAQDLRAQALQTFNLYEQLSEAVAQDRAKGLWQGS
jgi:hypothetical protein